jgi:hypothetical protein
MSRLAGKGINPVSAIRCQAQLTVCVQGRELSDACSRSSAVVSGELSALRPFASDADASHSLLSHN